MNPKQVRQEVQATCRDLHLAAWAGQEDAYTSCVDSNAVDGIMNFYTETVNQYNDLCFGTDHKFRDFFCGECDMLSQRVQAINKDSFRDKDDANKYGRKPASGCFVENKAGRPVAPAASANGAATTK